MLAQVFQLVKEGKAALIDVREQEEWDEEHIPCAIHLPLSSFSSAALPQEIPLFIHCRSGKRAQMVEIILKKEHFDVQALVYDFDEIKKIFT